MIRVIILIVTQLKLDFAIQYILIQKIPLYHLEFLKTNSCEANKKYKPTIYIIDIFHNPMELPDNGSISQQI